MKGQVAVRFAELIVGTSYGNLPEEVIHKAKLCILDFLGVALAGSRVGLAPLITDLVLPAELH